MAPAAAGMDLGLSVAAAVAVGGALVAPAWLPARAEGSGE